MSVSYRLDRAAAPTRRAWLGLLGRLRRTTSSGMLGELRGDVRTCEYGDVHVMWEMLGGTDDAAWMDGDGGSGSADSGRASATMAAAAAGRKRTRRSRRAAADAAAWSRLFSTCCAF